MRRPAEEFTQSMQTTADKIRALSNADYDRTKISKLLDIAVNVFTMYKLRPTSQCLCLFDLRL